MGKKNKNKSKQIIKNSKKIKHKVDKSDIVQPTPESNEEATGSKCKKKRMRRKKRKANKEHHDTQKLNDKKNANNLKQEQTKLALNSATFNENKEDDNLNAKKKESSLSLLEEYKTLSTGARFPTLSLHEALLQSAEKEKLEIASDFSAKDKNVVCMDVQNSSEDLLDINLLSMNMKIGAKIPREKRKNEGGNEMIFKKKTTPLLSPISNDTKEKKTDNDNEDKKIKINDKEANIFEKKTVLQFSDGEEVANCSSNDEQDDLEFFSKEELSVEADITDNNMTMTESREGNDIDNTNISLSKLKQKILGRKIEQDNSNDNEHTFEENVMDKLQKSETEKNANTNIPASLKGDLTCVICQEIFYKPMTLLCGHSFCMECIDWWYESSNNKERKLSSSAMLLSCPTCRSTNTPWDDKMKGTFGVNKSLQNCVVSLFGVELMKRMKAKKKNEAGENDGAHDRGYDVLTHVYCEEWTAIPVKIPVDNVAVNKSKYTSLKARRSIILDAESQVMQFALALQGDPELVVTNNQANAHSNEGSNTNKTFIKINLCLLHMEEDEAIDSYGFPIVAYSKDECLICTDEGRFGSSVLELFSKRESHRQHSRGGDTLTPVSRKELSQLNYNSMLEFLIEYNEYLDENDAATFIIRHDETGAELEIKLSSSHDKKDRKPSRSRRQEGYFMDDIDAQGHSDSEDDDLDEFENNGFFRKPSRSRCQEGYFMDDIDAQGHSDSEDEEEDLDEFENDGFLVGDDDNSSNVDASDEDEGCKICGHGGTLIVCDGGEWSSGCGSSFHIACINRDEIPSGDWICQECCSDKEIGVRGFEFPLPDSKNEDTFEEEAEDSSDDEEKEFVKNIKKGKGNLKTSVLESSSSESDLENDEPDVFDDENEEKSNQLSNEAKQTSEEVEFASDVSEAK